MAHPARTTILIVWLLASCRESAGSEVGAALAVGFGLLCAVCCHQGCALISQGNGALVERFGRLDRQLGPGFHLKLPFVERISAHLSTRERILDVPAQRCITSDNAPLMADAVIFYRIRDLTKAVYAIDDFRVGLQDVILTQLRSEIGQMTLDNTFSAREKLNAILLREANQVTVDWGIQVVRVEVRDILPSPEIVSAMELQLAAERKKRAAILESEGQRQAHINAAQARRDSVVLQAEGERNRLEAEAIGLSNALDALAQALGETADTTPESRASRQRAAYFMLERARIESALALAKSPNAKVVAMSPKSATSDKAALFGTAFGLAATNGRVPPDI